MINMQAPKDQRDLTNNDVVSNNSCTSAKKQFNEVSFMR